VAPGEDLPIRAANSTNVSEKSVFVAGNIVVDIIGKPIDRLPERGRLLLIDTLETHVGGNGPNVAAALARLGTPVAVSGRVGEDPYGRFVVSSLAEAGVDVGQIRRGPGVTGVTIVAVDSTGERSFLHHLGENARYGPDDLDWREAGSHTIFLLTAHFVLPSMDGAPAAGVLRRAREMGLRTALDVCWDREGRWWSLLGPCLPHVDYFLPSEEEARMLSGEEEPARMADFFLAHGCSAVAIKRGERGSYFRQGEQVIETPAFPVAVAETTGAGDCFVAGFLTGALREWDWPTTLRLANAVGAHSVGHVGAVTGVRGVEEIRRWMESR
jgi:sugar/nucleoside kinase (ribokinase family)